MIAPPKRSQNLVVRNRTIALDAKQREPEKSLGSQRSKMQLHLMRQRHSGGMRGSEEKGAEEAFIVVRHRQDGLNRGHSLQRPRQPECFRYDNPRPHVALPCGDHRNEVSFEVRSEGVLEEPYGRGVVSLRLGVRHMCVAVCSAFFTIIEHIIKGSFDSVSEYILGRNFLSTSDLEAPP